MDTLGTRSGTAAPAGVSLELQPNVMDVLLDRLEGEGVRHIFGVPGGALGPLYEALSTRTAIRPVLSKHEQGGAFMADGYARISGTLGVCCGIAGPGATNAVTGIASSRVDSVPVLMISSQVATPAIGRGAFQEGGTFGIDLVELFRPICKLSTMLVDAASSPRIIDRVIRTAMSGRPGPVHLNIPLDVAKRPVRGGDMAPRRRESPVRTCDPADVAAIVEMLRQAQCPAILAGHGVDVSDAAEALHMLAVQFQIPVATTPKAKGVFPEDHMLSLGVYGFGGHERARKFLTEGEVDLLLVFGSSLGEFQTNAWDPRLVAGKRLIQVDIDPSELGKSFLPDLPVIGDAGAVLVAVQEQLMRGPRPDWSRSVTRIEELRAVVPPVYDLEKTWSQSSPIKPQRLFAGLQRLVPEDARIVMDIGNCMSWLTHYYTIRGPRRLISNMGLSSMGYAIPASIGVKMADPSRTVVGVLGDGAFAMSGMEIHTAVELGLPIVWIVINDSGFGMVAHGDSLVFGRSISPTRYNLPINAAGIARNLGAWSARVEHPDEFEDAVREALACGRPALVDAVIDPTEIPGNLRARTETLKSMFAGKRS